MALVKCKECGSEVSTQARACPKCGRIQQSSLNLVTVLLIAVPIGLGIVWYMLREIVTTAPIFNR
jgi:hypothetical protein